MDMKRSTLLSPMNPSNKESSLTSGLTSLAYSPSNIASSTTQSRLNQNTRDFQGRHSSYDVGTPDSSINFQKGKFSKFVYGKPEILKEINPRYKNKDLEQETRGLDDLNDEEGIININVRQEDKEPNQLRDYQSEEENYESVEKHAEKPPMYEGKWYNRPNMQGAQDTITGLSDIKGATMESEYNVGHLGGTISSLVNNMSDMKRVALPADNYLNERARMNEFDPLQDINHKNLEHSPDEKRNPHAYHPSQYSSGNQTAYFNSEADMKTKQINATHSKPNLEEDRKYNLENQVASKSNIGAEDVIDDPEVQAVSEPYSSPLKNYNTDLFQINEEIPYSSTSMISDRKTEGNRPTYHK